MKLTIYVAGVGILLVLAVAVEPLTAPLVAWLVETALGGSVLIAGLESFATERVGDHRTKRIRLKERVCVFAPALERDIHRTLL